MSRAKPDEELVFKAQTGDLDAVDEVVRRWRNKIDVIVRTYRPIPGTDFDDRVSEALLGLYKSVKNYEWDKGASFETFAKRNIENALTDCYRRNTRDGIVPTGITISLDAESSDPMAGAATYRTTVGDMIAADDDTERDAINKITAETMPDEVIERIVETIYRAAAGNCMIDGRLRASLLSYTSSVFGSARASDLAELMGRNGSQPALMSLAPVRGTNQATQAVESIATGYATLCRAVIYESFDGHRSPEMRRRLIADGIVLSRSVVASIQSAISEVAGSLYSVA